MHDENILRKIANVVHIEKSSYILEIGPGTGQLTNHLLSLSDHIIAIEKDKQMISYLSTRFADQMKDCKLQIISGDVLKVALPYFDACVANIPYYVEPCRQIHS